MTSGWTIKPSMSWASVSAIETERIAASGRSASATFAARSVAFVGTHHRLERQRHSRAQHPRQRDEVERDRGISLLSHGRAADLAEVRRLLGFADLRALHERYLMRDLLRGAGEQPQGTDVLGATIERRSHRQGGWRQPQKLGHRGPARRAHVRAMAAKVPMPPPSAATNDRSSRAARRARCRLSSSSQPATLKPKVMGRACWPCVRPACGTSR